MEEGKKERKESISLLTWVKKMCEEAKEDHNVEDLWQAFFQEASEVNKEVFFETDAKGKTFFMYLNGERKRHLLSALDESALDERNKFDCREKARGVLAAAIEQKDLIILNDKNKLTDKCLFYYLATSGKDTSYYERDSRSFKRLQEVSLVLTSKMPGCPLGKTVFHYYCDAAGESFLKHVLDDIEDFPEHGVDRFNILSLLVKSNIDNDRVNFLLRMGGIAILSSYLDEKSLREYVDKQRERFETEDLFKRSCEEPIKNTLMLLKHLEDEQIVSECLEKKLYPLVFNEKGKTAIHVLAELGYEKAAIAFLKRYWLTETPLVIYDEHRESLWHVCVRYDRRQILDCLLSTPTKYPKYIDYADNRFVTPFRLAVQLGKEEIARLLLEKGATKVSRISDYFAFYLIPEQKKSALHDVVLKKNKVFFAQCQALGLLEAMHVSVTDVYGYTPLFYAAQQEDSTILESLLHCQGVNQALQNDLKAALQKGDRDGAAACIALSRRLHLRMPVDIPGPDGYTALFCAAQQEDDTFYKLLLSCLNVDKAKQSDLWHAVREGSAHDVEVCIRMRANLNEKKALFSAESYVYKGTVLDLARGLRKEAVIEKIVAAGGRSCFNADEIRMMKGVFKKKLYDAKGRPINELSSCYRKAKLKVTLPHPLSFKVGGLLLAGLCLYAAGIVPFTSATGITLTLALGIGCSIGITRLAQQVPWGKRAFAKTEEASYCWEHEVARKCALGLARGLSFQKQSDVIETLSQEFDSASHPRFYTTQNRSPWQDCNETKLTILYQHISKLEQVAKKKYAKPLEVCKQEVTRKARYRYF